VRISLITETYFPQVNGVSRTLDRLVRHLVARGDLVQILMPAYDEPAVVPEGTRVHTFRASALPFYREVRIPLTGSGRVARVLGEFGPDLAHITTEGPLGLAGLRAARRLGLPVVSSYHTNFAPYCRSYHAAWLEPVFWRYLRWFHNRTLATLCPTPSIRDLLLGKGFERVGIWSRGVDSTLFHPAKRSPGIRARYGLQDGVPLLINVGRLSQEKNIEVLLAAFRQVRTQVPAQLLLVGDGPVRRALVDQPPPGVSAPGFRSGTELASLYAEAELMVFPSLTDTFGNVIQEAMACGTPVIGFNAPGPRDIIRHHETGLVVDEQTGEALTAAILGLLREPGRLERMGHAARAYSETRDWDAVNRVVRDTYRAALEPSPQP
jgi:glycosyltransferase involved in cell wall biosynthesis